MAKNKKYLVIQLKLGNNFYYVDVFTNHTSANGRDSDIIIFNLEQLSKILPPSDYILIISSLRPSMPNEILGYNSIDI